jgi:hypothetical protein
LIDAVAELFKSLLKSGSEAVCDALATIMILAYLLGQRTGVSFSSIDQRIRNKLHISLDDSLGGADWQEPVRIAGLFGKNKEVTNCLQILLFSLLSLALAYLMASWPTAAMLTLIAWGAVIITAALYMKRLQLLLLYGVNLSLLYWIGGSDTFIYLFSFCWPYCL